MWEARPSGLTTQGRIVHGGLWRTCCVWLHSRSATQSLFSSWWKAMILRAGILEDCPIGFFKGSRYFLQGPFETQGELKPDAS